MSFRTIFVASCRLMAASCLLFLIMLKTSAEETATPTPYVPNPSLCLVEPISRDDLNRIAATPIAEAGPTRTPGVIPAGTPAAPDAIAGITATVRELVACFNAGELLRAYGLYTDDYLHRLFARQGALSVEAYAALATPEPETPEDRAAILDLKDVRLLDGGIVGATVTIKYAVIPMPKTFFFTFVWGGDRWWIDSILGEISFSVP